MTKTKISYGIDLGTTNSAISVMEDGDIHIIKDEKYQKDTSPSCVHFNKKKVVFAGDDALNRYRAEALNALRAFTHSESDRPGMNTFIEFKRTMGTDTLYESTHMGRAFSSEELSAEVLKYLKTRVREENISSAVVTVPAKFRQNQIDATQRAADLAGFSYCELLQEPVAASLAYGIDAKTMDGHWMVFDFGGGTFDVALMKVDEGIMKVADTEGDNHLGGKNIDYAIVDHILIPYLKENYTIDKLLADELGKTLLRDALKWFAEETKIVLSSKSEFEIYTDEPIGTDDTGEEMELDLKITLQDYESVARPIFQRAIAISETLLENKGLKGTDLKTVVLVGGPTLSQTLRNMLSESLLTSHSSLPTSSLSPMTAVARGAALFAATRDIPLAFQQRDMAKIQLTLKFPETTVETEEHVGIRVERSRTEGEIPQKLFVEIRRKDRGWSGGRAEISNKSNAGIFSVLLDEGKPNGFTIALSDEKGNACPCEPSEFTIIQGLKAANPTLPFALCIEALDSQKGQQRLQALRGLEKNQSLPAKGKEVFKTQQEIRAGNPDDVIRIPIYEGSPGTKAARNTQVHAVLITGKDLAETLPKDVDAEVTLEIDSSRRMKLSAYFPYIDETCESDVPDNTTPTDDAAVLETEIHEARQAATKLEKKCPGACKKAGGELNQLSDLLANAKGDPDSRVQVKERLQDVLKDLDKAAEENEWPAAEQELRQSLKKVADTHQRYGNEKSARVLEQYQQQAQAATEQQDVRLAKELTAQIRSLDFELVSQDIGLWISYIKKFDEQFDQYGWKDKAAARRLIDEAKQVIVTAPSKPKLQQIVKQLSGLLPETHRPLIDAIDKELLRTRG